MTRATTFALVTVLVAIGFSFTVRQYVDPDPPPPCTAGTSSVDASGHTTTVWYPKGCRPGTS